MLYLAFRGMTLFQIGLIESVFHVTSLLMEVPTGIIADRFGRRTSRLLGRIMAMIGTLLMIASRSFWGFVLAFVFVALSYNLESGAGDALIYDSLVQVGKQDRYMRVKGRQEVAYQAAMIVSLVASGIVATFDYLLAYYLALGIHALSFGLSLSFVEPEVGRPNVAAKRSGFFRHVADSFRALREHRVILVYILFIEGFSLFCTTYRFYFQNFLKSRGFVEWQIGIVLAGAAVAGMIGAANAHRVEKLLGARRLVSFSPFLALAAFALIAFTRLEIPAFILCLAMDGILYVSFSDYINRLHPFRAPCDPPVLPGNGIQRDDDRLLPGRRCGRGPDRVQEGVRRDARGVDPSPPHEPLAPPQEDAEGAAARRIMRPACPASPCRRPAGLPCPAGRMRRGAGRPRGTPTVRTRGFSKKYSLATAKNSESLSVA